MIVVDKGMIRLDSQRVWVDAWAFTSLCDHVGKHISNEPLPNPDVLLAWAGEINRLVVGRYLDGDEDGAAMEVVAEQLRERFVNNQEQLAEALAARKCRSDARIDAARRGAIGLTTSNAVT